MRTTVTVNDELLEAAREYAGKIETSALLNMALKAYIEREAARRLARLGGTEPDMTIPPRRRSAAE